MDMKTIIERMRCMEERCVDNLGEGVLELVVFDDWSGRFKFRAGRSLDDQCWDFWGEEEFVAALGSVNNYTL